MYQGKKPDGLMLFTAAIYLLVLLGFIEIAAAAYLLFLLGWLAKEMYRGFKIGRIEQREYKEREKNWKTRAVKVGKKESEQPALADESIANVAWDPL